MASPIPLSSGAANIFLYISAKGPELAFIKIEILTVPSSDTVTSSNVVIFNITVSSEALARKVVSPISKELDIRKINTKPIDTFRQCTLALLLSWRLIVDHVI